ncbi:hypothetical protein MPAR168_00785 [Methylorubrum populi]|uniref:Uncharacterized protein n=1 Tax=Methylobacterium radiotolerans TaxID=31998 RepID=A0ABU7T881_9HYPH
MRQTTYDQAAALIHAVNDAELVIAEAIRAGVADRRAMPSNVRAHEITQALDKAGFEIRYRPIDIVPGPAPVETETEKAARWASVLIAQILADGTARQAEAGVDAAAKDALARLRRDRGRIAFEDLDKNPPMGACHASDLFAGWARSLGEKVEWCEARLLPRRLVLTAVLHREPSQEERADLDWRLKFLGQMGGVVGTSVNASVNLGTGAAQVEVEVRFAHYITTIGVEYTPGDLPAHPARKAA